MADAAVAAADERMNQLWIDLRLLAEAATSSGTGREAATSASGDLVEVGDEIQTNHRESSGERAAGPSSSTRPPGPPPPYPDRDRDRDRVRDRDRDRDSSRGDEEHENGLESDGRASKYWKELFGGGGGGGSGSSSEREEFECPPEPREPPVTQPSLRLPKPQRNTAGVACMTPSPWQVNCFGGGDTEVGTRIRAVGPGSSGAGGVAAPSDGEKRVAADEKKRRLPTPQHQPQPQATTATTTTAPDTSDSRSIDVYGATGKIVPKAKTTGHNSVLRHAIDVIVRGGRRCGGEARDGEGAREALRLGESLEVTMERERRVTSELREGVAQLRAEQHKKAVDEVNARRRLANERVEEEEERRFEAESARQSPPVPVTDVVFHRAVQTVVECRSVSTQTVESGDVYIDASLLDGHPGVRGRGRQSRKETTRHAPPWGGGGGGKCHNRVDNNKPGRESASLLQYPAAVKGTASPWLLPGKVEEVRRRRRASRQDCVTADIQTNVAGNLLPLHPSQLLRDREDDASTSGEMSRFEERCAIALSRHLSSLDIRRRQLVMDDWGAADGGFEGAELCIRIEVTAVGQKFVPVQPQPLRQLRLCLGSFAGGFGKSGFLSLGRIKVDYDHRGHCQLPALCACVVYRERRRSDDEYDEDISSLPERHFLHFSFRKLEHGRIFRRAVRLL